MGTNRLLLVAAIAVPVSLLALAGWLNYRQVQREASHHAVQSARALSEHAQRTLRTHELLIEFVDRQVAGQSWPQLASSQPLHHLLVRLAERNPEVASIFLMAPDGRTFVSSRRFPMPPLDASDRDYYRALRERDELYVSAHARGRLSNDRFFSVARRRSSADGGFSGLIAVSVNPTYFESFYGTLAGPAEAASLVRADGAVLARYPQVADAPAALPPTSRFLNELERSPESGVYATRSLTDGLERLIAYRKVGEYPVYASYQISLDSLWAAWRRAMAPYALACLLALALLLAGARLAEQRTRRAAAEARSHEAEGASRAKDLFVAALSHELRNPLAAISAASELLQRTGSAAQSASRSAGEVIARQVTQLRRMLDDLLDTSRAVHGKLRLELRRLDLGALAGAAFAEHAERTGVHGGVTTPGEGAWVEGDPVRLKQLLDNLLENAVKYGARRIDITVASTNGSIELSVRDDGEGLAPELLPRLFTPFVQGEQSLDRARGGLGLGLAMAHRFALLHGGALAAASAGPGKGSTFTVTLPRAEPPVRRIDLASVRSQSPARRLVVIDDDGDARESLRLLLESEGHEVHAAADGPSGLEAIRRVQPHAALIDIGLPGMDGYDTARAARARPNAPILVAITGYGQTEDRDKARRAGFHAHLTKPFTYDELMAVLVEAGRQKSLEDAA